MKPATILAAAAIGWSALAGPPAENAATKAFDRLKALAGTWEADSPAGGKLTDTIRLVSNGTAIEETIGIPSDNEVSLYTRAADRIAMTHYCALTPGGHQVRFDAPVAAADRDEFIFAFVRAENLAKPEAAHMRRMVLRLNDRDHFSEVWTKSEAGKDTVFTLNFVRLIQLVLDR